MIPITLANKYNVTYHAKHAVKRPIIKVVFQEHVEALLNILRPHPPTGTDIKCKSKVIPEP